MTFAADCRFFHMCWKSWKPREENFWQRSWFIGVLLRNGEKSVIPACAPVRCCWRGRQDLHYKSFIHNQSASQTSHHGNVWDCGCCCRLSGNSLCHLCMYNTFKILTLFSDIHHLCSCYHLCLWFFYNENTRMCCILCHQLTEQEQFKSFAPTVA